MKHKGYRPHKNWVVYNFVLCFSLFLSATMTDVTYNTNYIRKCSYRETVFPYYHQYCKNLNVYIFSNNNNNKKKKAFVDWFCCTSVSTSTGFLFGSATFLPERREGNSKHDYFPKARRTVKMCMFPHRGKEGLSKYQDMRKWVMWHAWNK